MNDKVTDPNGTGTPSGVTGASETPAGVVGTGEGDAIQKQLDEIRTQLKQRDEDINKLKSSYDKKLYQQDQEHKQKAAAYEAEIEKYKLSQMDDTAKKQYEADKEAKRLQDLKSELDNYKREKAEIEQRANYIKWFGEVYKVPPEKLDNSGSVDALVESGWKAVAEKLEASERALADAQKTLAEKNGEVTPPEVVENTTGSAKTGYTWKELADKFGGGDLNKVFELIEQGKLPKDILPK